MNKQLDAHDPMHVFKLQNMYKQHVEENKRLKTEVQRLRIIDKRYEEERKKFMTEISFDNLLEIARVR